MAVIFILPLMFGLTGCSGGGINGEGTNDYANNVGTPSINGNAYIEKGWSYITSGQYDSAIVQFNKISSDSSTVMEIAMANNGIAWATARTEDNKLEDGMPWFIKAADLLDDAKVGLAAAYINEASREDLERVIDLLFNQLGKGNALFEYVPVYPTGVSDAEVHAMLAFAYAATGDDELAREQLEHAKEIDPDLEGTILGQLTDVIDFILQ